jgi:hypothetical protein
MQYDPKPSRRHAIQAGAGIITTPILLGSVAAQDQEASQLRDPRILYPRPPFKRQPQEPPGLASKMDPRPDHGEKSYKG